MATIFVFGSNTQGRHGLGAAKFARTHYGAITGQSHGRQGNSYAIVTKTLVDGASPITLAYIEDQVNDLLTHIRDNPQNTYLITRFGAGLAGFTAEEMQPLWDLLAAEPNAALLTA